MIDAPLESSKRGMLQRILKVDSQRRRKTAKGPTHSQWYHGTVTGLSAAAGVVTGLESYLPVWGRTQTLIREGIIYLGLLAARADGPKGVRTSRQLN